MPEQEPPDSERVLRLKEKILSSFMELPVEEQAQFTLVLTALVMQSPHAHILSEGLHFANVHHPDDVTIRATSVALRKAGLSQAEILALSAEDYEHISQAVRDYIVLDVLPDELVYMAREQLDKKQM
jgi:hypothetical protein